MNAENDSHGLMEIKELIESLKGNPIFHMSLGSSELFHSNFLAWLSQKSLPILLIGLISDEKFLSRLSPNATAQLVQREYNNIDLLIKFAHDGRNSLLAVEVKVKDVLRPSQLKDYDSTIENIRNNNKEIDPENVYKIALTLAESEVGFSDWQVVTFQQLNKRWCAAGSKLDGDDQVFFSYYQNFVEELSCLVAKVTDISQPNLTKLTPFSRIFYPDEEINKQLTDDLRLHSTFGKRLANNLAYSLMKDVEHCDYFKEIPVLFGTSKKYEGDPIFIAASGGFERGQAFTSISLNWIPVDQRTKGKEKELLSLGVMLQDGQYRMIICHPSFNFARGRASDEARRKQMFEFADDVGCLEWLGRAESATKEDLKGYAPKYIYTARPIPTDRLELKNFVINDLRDALFYLEKEIKRQNARSYCEALNS